MYVGPALWRSFQGRAPSICCFCPSQTRAVPQKKATGPTPLGCFVDEDFFFGLDLRILGIDLPKDAFVGPKKVCAAQAKILPKKKVTGPKPLGCICDKLHKPRERCTKFKFLGKTPGNR